MDNMISIKGNPRASAVRPLSTAVGRRQSSILSSRPVAVGRLRTAGMSSVLRSKTSPPNGRKKCGSNVTHERRHKEVVWTPCSRIKRQATAGLAGVGGGKSLEGKRQTLFQSLWNMNYVSMAQVTTVPAKSSIIL